MIHLYYAAVRLLPDVRMGRPALAFTHRSPLTRDTGEVSRFSCRKYLGVSGVFDYAGLCRGSRLRPGSMLPSASLKTSASWLNIFGAPYPAHLLLG